MPIDAGRRVPAHHLVALLLLVLGCRGAALPAGHETALAGLTDERIAGTALLLNDVERGEAALAVSRAVDPEVRAYARRVQTDHASLHATLASVLDQLGIAAQDDPRGGALRDSAVVRRERLQSIGARGFDAAYVDADLRSHRELLAIVGALMPDARRPALRDYLAALRPVLAAHVAHAEQLRATLAVRAR